MTKITIDRAVVEQALHVATGAGYPVALIAALRAALAEPVQEPQKHLLQQALEALLMMRDRYGEYACPACAHADAAVYALRAALAEEALQRLTDVQQEIEAALAEPVPPIGKASTDVGVPVFVVKKAEPPCNPSCAPGYCYCEPVEPVAYSVGRTLHWHEGRGVNDAQLYAAPPQRKPLAEEALSKIIDAEIGFNSCVGWEEDFARAIERAHGIKEEK